MAESVIDVHKLGQNIYNLRDRLGWSLDYLSGMSGVAKSVISNAENGNQLPTLNSLVKIAYGMRATINRLLEDAVDLPAVEYEESFLPQGLDDLKRLFNLSQEDVEDLAAMQLRDKQPVDVIGWLNVYLAFTTAVGRPLPETAIENFPRNEWPGNRL